MSNILLRILNLVAVHTGILLVIDSDYTLLQGTVTSALAVNGVDTAHYAPLSTQDAVTAGWHLLLGIALVLIGLGIHAYMTSRGERPVKVRVKDPEPKPEPTRDVIWMNIKV